MDRLWISTVDSTVSSQYINYKEFIRQNEDLNAMTKLYIDIIAPKIMIEIDTIGKKICDSLSVIHHIHDSSNFRKMKRRELDRVITDAYHEQDKLMCFITKSAPKELLDAASETTHILPRLKDNISERQKSINLRRSICIGFITFMAFVMLIFSIWFVCVKVAKVAGVVTGIFATGILTLEPFASTALRQKQQKLNEEKKVIDTMEHGVKFMLFHFKNLYEEMHDYLASQKVEFQVMSEQHVGEEALLRVKMLGAVRLTAFDMKRYKRKINQYGDEVQMLKMTFLDMIKEN
ncbi:uncharacterized protein LOC122011686 [Zingiber officinale]|uniref:uncharacterized protein LOC122011686 n=1 Tax=Zingiber officinale TaxID=94328 RepID=UPI001C4C7DB2|nr:uncharacterized protein LOC122011686 [Zingiber officinale]